MTHPDPHTNGAPRPSADCTEKLPVTAPDDADLIDTLIVHDPFLRLAVTAPPPDTRPADALASAERAEPVRAPADVTAPHIALSSTTPPPPDARPPQPSWPMDSDAWSRRPPSIAPVALDATRPAAPSLAALPVVDRGSTGVWIGAGLAAIAAVALVAAAMTVVALRPSAKAGVATKSPARLEVRTDARSVESPRATTARVAAAPPAPPPATTTPATAAAKPTTGTLLLPRSGAEVYVDGALQPPGARSASVACGRRWVKVGAAVGRAVDVPCGGTTTL